MKKKMKKKKEHRQKFEEEKLKQENPENHQIKRGNKEKLKEPKNKLFIIIIKIFL